MKMATGLILLVFCVGGAAPCTHAKDDTSGVALMPHWNKGDEVRYTMVKGRRKTQGAKTVGGKGITPVRIEVLDVNEAGYLIGWTAGETQIQDPAQAADPLAKALVDLTKDFTIVFQLDSETKLRGIRNWRQLQAVAHKVVDMSVKEAKKTGANDADCEKVRQQLLSMFATKQQVEILFARSSQIFFAPLGMEYPAGRSLEYEDKLPNPLGGEPFPTRASFTLEKLDRASDNAVVTWRQEIDPVAGARVLEKALKDLAARMGKPIPAGKIFDYVNIKDTASFTLHPSSGWPRKLSHTRTTTIAGVSQEDSLTFIEVEQ